MPLPRTPLRRRPLLALIILILLLLAGYAARALHTTDHSPAPAPVTPTSSVHSTGAESGAVIRPDARTGYRSPYRF